MTPGMMIADVGNGEQVGQKLRVLWWLMQRTYLTNYKELLQW